MNKMKAKIIFCRPTYHPIPLFAWAIMIFQMMNPFKKESFSHCVFQYFSISRDQIMYIHITGRGVHWQTEEKFLSEYRRCKAYRVNLNTDSDKVESWLSHRLDKKYDKLQIVGLILNVLCLTKTNLFGSDLVKYICSEFIADLLTIGVEIELGDSDNWDLLMLQRKLIDISYETVSY